MVTRQYEFLALERLTIGSKVRVTEKGMLFQSTLHAKTFKTEGFSENHLQIRFNGIIYELNRETKGLEKVGEYWPYEGIKGALWE